MLNNFMVLPWIIQSAHVLGASKPIVVSGKQNDYKSLKINAYIFCFPSAGRDEWNDFWLHKGKTKNIFSFTFPAVSPPTDWLTG